MKLLKKICLLTSSLIAIGLHAMQPGQDLALLHNSLTALAQAVQTTPGSRPDAPNTGAQPTPLLPITPTKIIKEFKLNNGVTISVVEGDLVQQNVQAIVNAANSSLAHGAGIAKIISDEAGPQLEEFQKKEKLRCELGKACTTPSFALKNKYAKTIDFIIHAVGPNCKNQEEKATWVTELRKAYKSSLQEAINWGAKSIAFPAISVGIFDCPTKLAAHTAAFGLYEMMPALEASFLKDIRFVVWTDEQSKAFGDELITQLPITLQKYMEEPFTIATWNSLDHGTYIKVVRNIFKEKDLAQPELTKKYGLATMKSRQEKLDPLLKILKQADIIAYQELGGGSIFTKQLSSLNKPLITQKFLAIQYNPNKFDKVFEKFVDIPAGELAGFLVTVFKTKSKPEQYLGVINVHLKGGGGKTYAQDRVAQLQASTLKQAIDEANKKVAQLTKSEVDFNRWIILGDFNTNSAAYDQVFTSEGAWQGYPSLANANKGDLTTAYYAPTDKPDILDHIFYTPASLTLGRFEVTPPVSKQAATLLTHGKSKNPADAERTFPSDHAIVEAQFTFKQPTEDEKKIAEEKSADEKRAVS